MRAGIVGVGPHGKRFIQVFSRIEGVDLVAVADRSEDALRELKLSDATKTYTDANAMFESERLDLVCIATNGPSHSALGIAAMNSGISRVMIEKPMACSVEDCEQLIFSAEKNKSRLSINHSRRYSNFYQWIRNQIQTGDWGGLRSIYIQRPGMGLGCLGTHSFDLACFLSGLSVKAVTAWLDSPISNNPRGQEFEDPSGLVVLEMRDSDVRGIISQIEDGAGPMSVEINLTRAQIKIDEKHGETQIFLIEKRPGQAASYQRVNPPAGVHSKMDMVEMSEGLIRELISTDPILSHGRCGLESIEILVAAHLSHQAGHRAIEIAKLSTQDRKLRLAVT